VRGPQHYKHDRRTGTKVVHYVASWVEKVTDRLQGAVPQSVIKLIRKLTFKELQEKIFSAERFSEVMDNSACQSLTGVMVNALRDMIGNFHVFFLLSQSNM